MVDNKAKDKSVTCPYFVNGNCKFSEKSCNNSHSRRKTCAPYKDGRVLKIPSSFVFPDEKDEASSIEDDQSQDSPRYKTLSFRSKASKAATNQTASILQFKLPSLPESIETIDIPIWSIDNVIFHLVHADKFSTIREWMSNKSKEEIERDLKEYDGISPLFYAVARNCPKSVDLLRQYGLLLDVTAFRDAIPLLACGSNVLSLGANGAVIPIGMWYEFQETPRRTAAPKTKTTAEDKWCKQEYRNILAKALNLTMRYLLHVQDNQGAPNKKQLQIANRDNLHQLFTMSYHLIGQQHASRAILEALWGNLSSTHRIVKDKPLVFLFAGPSGHGKTELARNFGNLLNVNFLHQDASKWTHELDVFGSTTGYANHDDGTPLNNFLADNSGMRSVVFVDEFCRSKKDVYNTLLTILDTGMHNDRRHVNSPVNCSKTIWIFASNHVDPHVIAFCDKWLNGKSEEERRNAPYDVLHATLLPPLREKFTNLAGHLTHIIPFFPFSAEEAAVVAHKYVLALGDGLRQKIDTKNGNWRGHIHLEVADDGQLCKKLAKDSYFASGESRNSGARCIADEVNSSLEAKLNERLFAIDEEVTDYMNYGPFSKFSTEVQMLGQNLEIIKVFQDGEIEAPRKTRRGEIK